MPANGTGADREADDGTERADPASSVVSSPSDAFGALGNEIRMGVLETMLERTDDGEPRATFSELFDASDVETSAGFAYHLDLLEGPYLRKTEEGYELTYAGSKIARAIAAGAYTRRVDRDPVDLAEPCPFCDADALAARSADNVVTVACDACSRALLSLRFPPAGLEAHGDRLPEAFDRHHRHRLALARDGVCPECAGEVASGLVRPAEAVADALPDERPAGAQAVFECRTCGHDVRCPVSLALLEHPAVVSFYRERDRSVRDRPIWNVGHEWGEAVLSTEPWCVRVTVDLDGDVLALYVDDSVRVREVQRAGDLDADAGSRTAGPDAAAAETATE